MFLSGPLIRRHQSLKGTGTKVRKPLFAFSWNPRGQTHTNRSSSHIFIHSERVSHRQALYHHRRQPKTPLSRPKPPPEKNGNVRTTPPSPLPRHRPRQPGSATTTQLTSPTATSPGTSPCAAASARRCAASADTRSGSLGFRHRASRRSRRRSSSTCCTLASARTVSMAIMCALG